MPRRYIVNHPIDFNPANSVIQYRPRPVLSRPVVPRRPIASAPNISPRPARRQQQSNSKKPSPEEWARRLEQRKRASFERRRAAVKADPSIRFRSDGVPISPPLDIIFEDQAGPSNQAGPSRPSGPCKRSRPSESSEESGSSDDSVYTPTSPIRAYKPTTSQAHQSSPEEDFVLIPSPKGKKESVYKRSILQEISQDIKKKVPAPISPIHSDDDYVEVPLKIDLSSDDDAMVF